MTYNVFGGTLNLSQSISLAQKQKGIPSIKLFIVWSETGVLHVTTFKYSSYKWIHTALK